MRPDRIDNSRGTPVNLTNSIDDLQAGVMVTKNIIGYIKNLQYPKSSLPWLATLSFLPLALYFRFVIVTSLVLYKNLGAYTQNAWILGNFYQSQGDLQKSLEIYQTALYQYILLDAFSQNVAARFPLPGIYLDCFPEVKTYIGKINPGLEAAKGLAALDCQQAACIYQALLRQFPPMKIFKTRWKSYHVSWILMKANVFIVMISTKDNLTNNWKFDG